MSAKTSRGHVSSGAHSAPRRKQKKKRPVARVPVKDPFNVTITTIGHGGYGIAETEYGPVYVPHTLVGEQVCIRLSQKVGQGWQADLHQIVSPSLQRISPACAHFGKCGGCHFQHWQPDLYADWKQQRVENLCDREQLEVHTLYPMQISPSQSRRRAHFHLKLDCQEWVIGYYGYRSHTLEPVSECPLLHPALEALIQPLRQLCHDFAFTEMKQADCQINLSESGLDLVLSLGVSGCLNADHYALLADWCDQQDIARLHVVLSEAADQEMIPIVTRRVPVRQFGCLRVSLPPGGFLQATEAGELSLVTFLKTEIANWIELNTPRKTSWQLADLFCGVGTFTGLLSQFGSVQAFESDPYAVAALLAARNQIAHSLSHTLEIHQRDLFQYPLRPDELAQYDIIVLDPPRAGALAQVRQLAKADISLICIVSCHLNNFVRDGKILQDYGYKMLKLCLVDQFLWSSHQEIAAIFVRKT